MFCIQTTVGSLSLGDTGSNVNANAWCLCGEVCKPLDHSCMDFHYPASPMTGIWLEMEPAEVDSPLCALLATATFCLASRTTGEAAMLFWGPQRLPTFPVAFVQLSPQVSLLTVTGYCLISGVQSSVYFSPGVFTLQRVR